MKRRTLDLMFSFGGVALAALLFVLGLVLSSNASFANDYVGDQLAAQKITFKAAADLTEEESQSACIVEYAGQALTTGKQAECYAKDFIGLHVASSAEGKTYAELGVPQSQLRAQVAEAQQNSAPNLAALQKELADITATRETVFKGETLKGLLLTSYGFSVFGVKADQAATIAFIGAGLMLLLSLAGLVHARKTPKSQGFAVPEIVLANGQQQVEPVRI